MDGTNEEIFRLVESVLAESGRMDPSESNAIHLSNIIGRAADELVPRINQRILDTLNEKLDGLKKCAPALLKISGKKSPLSTEAIVDANESGVLPWETYHFAFGFLRGKSTLKIGTFGVEVPMETSPGEFETVEMPFDFEIGMDEYFRRRPKPNGYSYSSEGAHAVSPTRERNVFFGDKSTIRYNIQTGTSHGESDAISTIESSLADGEYAHLKFSFDMDEKSKHGLSDAEYFNTIFIRPLDRKTFLHELDHLIDLDWRNKRSGMKAVARKKGNRVSTRPYFSRPTEINARWQEFLDSLRDTAKTGEIRPAQWTIDSILRSRYYEWLVRGVSPNQKRQIMKKLPEVLEWIKGLANEMSPDDA